MGIRWYQRFDGSLTLRKLGPNQNRGRTGNKLTQFRCQSEKPNALVNSLPRQETCNLAASCTKLLRKYSANTTGLLALKCLLGLIVPANLPKH